MKFQLNLLENSYEYFFDSLDQYFIANEYGEHDQERSTLNNKKKWKLAFVFIVQALELLMKEIVCRINHTLVFENIDTPAESGSKTVSFSKLLVRFSNFVGNTLSDDETLFLKSCVNIRNHFVHYIVDISSSELKSKYCKLVNIFINLHEKTIDSAFDFKTNEYRDLSTEIVLFNQQYTIFRGMELTFESKELLQEEIELNRKYMFYIDNSGTKHLRIKFGEENDVLIRNGHAELKSPSYDCFDYCADCAAKKGEYHLDNCDLEICPICFGQALSCDCEADLCDESGNIYESPYGC